MTNALSRYAIVFNETSHCWVDSREMNLKFLEYQQYYANQLLKRKGHLRLNDVYAMLGLPRTIVGYMVGWVYEENNQIGDNYIDFGIPFNDYPSDARIVLDFNVDGDITGRI